MIDNRPSPVCVMGAGYVGLVTAACLADGGVEVRLYDVDADKLAQLRSGRSPLHITGVEDLIGSTLKRGTLMICDDVATAMDRAEVAILAVGTPPHSDGRADLRQVRTAIVAAVAHAAPGTVIVIKSTIPPGSTATLRDMCQRKGHAFPLVMSPEFLREGSAVEDYLNPSQVVIGGDDCEACATVARLFAHPGAPTVITDSTSAELIKYGVNSFLALKISFINEMAQVCESTGADITSVAAGLGGDPRIGPAFLGAGLGFGGSCFPKDVRALDQAASFHGQTFGLLRAAVEVNAQQRTRFVAKIQKAVHGNIAGKRIAILGLAFKPGTDDVRNAASIDVIRHLEDLGAHVVATDPAAMANAARVLSSTEMAADAYTCATGADAIAIVTEWPDFLHLDWERIAALVRRPLVVDGRNCLDPARMAAAGFTYIGVGRPIRRPQAAAKRIRLSVESPKENSR